MKHAEFHSIRIGDTASCEFEVTEQHLAQFAAMSLDDNQLHMNQSYAEQRGFDGRVAHGMITLSAISRLIGTELPGHGSLWMSQQFQFLEPVMIGDTLKATVKVEQISNAAEAVVLATEVTNVAKQSTVLRGKAGVRVPRHEHAKHATAADQSSNG